MVDCGWLLPYGTTHRQGIYRSGAMLCGKRNVTYPFQVSTITIWLGTLSLLSTGYRLDCSQELIQCTYNKKRIFENHRWR